MFVSMHTCMWVQRPRSMPRCFPLLLFILFVRHGLSVNLELTGWPASSRAHPQALSTPTGMISVSYHLYLFTWVMGI